MLTVIATVLLCQLADSRGARPFDWAVPKPLATAEVGSGRLEALGLPLDMHLARSKWKLGDLAVHYARRFVQAGFYIPPDQKPIRGTNLPRLSALDPVSMWSYTIVFYPEADGTTTLLLGAADLGHRRATELNDFPAPLFPGAENAATFELEAAHALTFSTTASPQELSSFYRSTLTGAGWAERPDSPGTYARGGRQLRVLHRPEGKRNGVVVLEEPDTEERAPKRAP